MRRVTLTFGIAALVFSVGCDGGTDSVPLTITMPDNAPSNGPVSKVEFPTVNAGTSYLREADEIQYRVGDLGAAPSGRFDFTVDYYLGNAATAQSQDFSFDAESTCEGGATEGNIDRIACAVVGKGGDRLVCTATYDRMDNPPDTCKGTQACIRCTGGSRACGSNPVC